MYRRIVQYLVFLAGTPMYYQVRAYKRVGAVKVFSVWSAVVNATTSAA